MTSETIPFIFRKPEKKAKESNQHKRSAHNSIRYVNISQYKNKTIIFFPAFVKEFIGASLREMFVNRVTYTAT